MLNRLLRLLVVASLMLPALSLADSPVQIATTAQVEKAVVGPDGQRQLRLVPAETVVPGTEVVYTITVSNQGAEPARDVVVDNPVPSHSEFVVGSAVAPGSEVTFSADGGQTYGVAEAVLVREQDGVQRPARADEYTHVRFAFQPLIAPGQSVMARFRAVIK